MNATKPTPTAIREVVGCVLMALPRAVFKLISLVCSNKALFLEFKHYVERGVIFNGPTMMYRPANITVGKKMIPDGERQIDFGCYTGCIRLVGSQWVRDSKLLANARDTI